MNVRNDYAARILGRALQRLAKGTVIVKRRVSGVSNGFLNAAQSARYAPVAIPGCDIWLASERRKETRTGVGTDADAVVWMDAASAAMIDEDDTINIGGRIQKGVVQGGINYRVKSVDAYDSIIGDRTKIELEECDGRQHRPAARHSRRLQEPHGGHHGRPAGGGR